MVLLYNLSVEALIVTSDLQDWPPLEPSVDTKAGTATMQRTLFCTRAIKTLTPSESNHSTTAALLPLTLHRRSCHILRFGLHMPLQGTSERRPRALQITARSSSYLQPTIIAARSCLYDGAALQQLPRSSEQKAEPQPGSFFCSVTWKQRARVWLSFHRCSSVESIPGISPQTVRSGNVCKANSCEWRGGLLQAPYPRAYPPPPHWKHIST